MFHLAKVLQAFAVADVAYALFVGVTEEHGMRRELTLTLVGVSVFVIGRLLERRA